MTNNINQKPTSCLIRRLDILPLKSGRRQGLHSHPNTTVLFCFVLFVCFNVALHILANGIAEDHIIVGLQPPQGLPVCNLKPANTPTTHLEGRERLKKEADHSWLVGSRFNEHRNLHTGFVLGGHKMSRSPHPSARILKVYIILNWAQSHKSSRWSQHISISRMCPWAASSMGKARGGAYSKHREGGEAPLIARILPTGQPAVLSSLWSLLTIICL